MMVLREERRSVAKEAFVCSNRVQLFRSKQHLFRQQCHKIQGLKGGDIPTVEIFNDNTDFTVIMNR